MQQRLVNDRKRALKLKAATISVVLVIIVVIAVPMPADLAIGMMRRTAAKSIFSVVDGGGIVVAATKPTFGRRAVSRQWANAKKKVGVPVLAEVRQFNGEPAIIVRLADAPGVVVAIVHLETRAGRIVAVCAIRDPRRLVPFCEAAA